jgi:Uma2 family endonuclease
MSETAEKLMTVDEFFVWAEGREGKWELHDGRPVEKGEPADGRAFTMAPERARHSRVKALAATALEIAMRRDALACAVYADGLAVRVNSRRAFIPDVLVTRPPAPPSDLETTTPLIVVEVLSPSTAAFDHGAKLEGYFSLPSLAHYLLIDPDRAVLILHSRAREGVIETRILHEGAVRLDPPGLAFEVAELFAA